MIEAVGGAILHVLQPNVLFATAAGTVIGIIIGALPGLTATMGMALLSPFTFFMEPVSGISMLIGLYKGGTFGGTGTFVGGVNSTAGTAVPGLSPGIATVSGSPPPAGEPSPSSVATVLTR